MALFPVNPPRQRLVFGGGEGVHIHEQSHSMYSLKSSNGASKSGATSTTVPRSVPKRRVWPCCWSSRSTNRATGWSLSIIITLFARSEATNKLRQLRLCFLDRNGGHGFVLLGFCLAQYPRGTDSRLFYQRRRLRQSSAEILPTLFSSPSLKA